MSRGLPLSIIVHLGTLGLLAVWGAYVPQPPLSPQRILRVQIAHLPLPQAQVAQPSAEPPAEPAVGADRPPAEAAPKEPVLPPKDVPKETRKQPETKPEPVLTPPSTAADTRADSAIAAAVLATASGPAVSGTDVDFPFAWYLNRVEGIVARQWNPRQLGFREGSARSCVVHFMIDRAGRVAQVTLVRSSGVSLFDREAVRAVKAASLPSLPPKFPHRALGVTFVFTLQSGV